MSRTLTATVGVPSPLLVPSPFRGPVPTAAATAPTTVTADAAAHTKGLWIELIPALSVPMTHLGITVGAAQSATNTATLMDIGIGAAAAEVTVVPNLAVGSWQQQTSGLTFLTIPLRAQAGARVAARIQSVVTLGKVATVVAIPMSDGGTTSPPAVDVLGISTGTSRGTALTTSDTYVQITAATAQAYRALIMVPSGNATTMNAETSDYTMAIGASGSEVAVGRVNLTSYTTETVSFVPGIVPLSVPQGTRIACKQSLGRAYRDVCVIGVP